MLELLRNDLVVITREPGDLIVLRRTAVPLTDVVEVQHFVEDFRRVLPLRQRRTLKLLQDLRAGRLISSPELERTMGAFVPRIIEGFARRAVLVATAVGKLQVTRMAQQGGLRRDIFTDEEAARAYLAEPL